MSYLGEFDRAFMRHTLALVEGYDGDYPATLLVNCLLGLLVVPRESYLKAVPADSIDDIARWGIRRESIRSPGRVRNGDPVTTLRQLVEALRHAVAHFNVTAIADAAGETVAFEYTNGRGLHAVISIAEMRVFVSRLATHLQAA